jgi:hypothetical protein
MIQGYSLTGSTLIRFSDVVIITFNNHLSVISWLVYPFHSFFLPKGIFCF